MAKRKSMRIAKLQSAAEDLEKAAAEAVAALWYLEHGSDKSDVWGYDAIQLAERGLEELRQLFPKESYE